MLKSYKKAQQILHPSLKAFLVEDVIHFLSVYFTDGYIVEENKFSLNQRANKKRV